mgnify:CR=1 FL=1
MLSYQSKVRAISSEWVVKFSTSVLSQSEIEKFKVIVKLLNVNLYDVLDDMDNYELSYVEDKWLAFRK